MTVASGGSCIAKYAVSVMGYMHACVKVWWLCLLWLTSY